MFKKQGKLDKPYTQKNLHYYSNVIRSCNNTVSDNYARQQEHISPNDLWEGGNFFRHVTMLKFNELRCGYQIATEGDERDHYELAF